MAIITIKHRGDFHKLDKYLVNVKDAVRKADLDKFGRRGVEALAANTPVDSGETARSWRYEIKRQSGSVSISFHNTNINNGVPIAIILQYGHGTRNGGWVEGRDYINPAIQSVFDAMADEAWKEVTRL